MKSLTPLLLLLFSMNIAAAPIKWTSVDTCPDINPVVCGSFYFDIDTGEYSFIDLTFDGEFTGHFENATGGDQYHLNMLNPVPPVHFVTLRLSGFDLSNPVQQSFDWEYDFRSIIHFEGSGQLVPSFEPPPNPVPVPGTFFLLGMALTVLRLVRRTGSSPLRHQVHQESLEQT